MKSFPKRWHFISLTCPLSLHFTRRSCWGKNERRWGRRKLLDIPQAHWCDAPEPKILHKWQLRMNFFGSIDPVFLWKRYFPKLCPARSCNAEEVPSPLLGIRRILQFFRLNILWWWDDTNNFNLYPFKTWIKTRNGIFHNPCHSIYRFNHVYSFFLLIHTMYVFPYPNFTTSSFEWVKAHFTYMYDSDDYHLC